MTILETIFCVFFLAIGYGIGWRMWQWHREDQ